MVRSMLQMNWKRKMILCKIEEETVGKNIENVHEDKNANFLRRSLLMCKNFGISICKNKSNEMFIEWNQLRRSKHKIMTILDKFNRWKQVVR